MLSVYTGKRPGFTLMPAICIIGCLGVLLCLFNLAFLCKFMLAGTIPVGLGMLLRHYIGLKKKPEIMPELIIMLLAAGLFTLLNWGRLYTLNDEFSHWGLAVKNLVALGRLGVTGETNCIFESYPPFATVVCYLATCFEKNINEGATFVAMNMCYIGAVLPALSVLCERDRRLSKLPESVLAAVLMLVCVIVFKLSALTIIAVDTLLGTMAFYIFAILSENKEKIDTPSICFAALAAFSLSLTKDTGLAFVCFGALTAFALIYKKKYALSGLAAVLISGIGAKLLWSSVKKYYGVSSSREGAFTTLSNIIRNGFTPVQKTATAAFFKASVSPNLSVGIPLVVFLVFFAALAVFIQVMCKKQNVSGKAFGPAFCVLGGCFIAYYIGMLVSYWGKFSDAEASGVASFERYLGSYLTFGLLVFAFIIIPAVLPYIRRKIPAGVFGAVSGGALAVFILFFAFLYPYTTADSIEQRSALASRGLDKMCAEEGIDKASVIIIVAPEYDNGLWLMTNYNAAPYRVISSENWEGIISSGGADYVYFDTAYDMSFVESVFSAAGCEVPEEVTGGNIYRLNQRSLLRK